MDHGLNINAAIPAVSDEGIPPDSLACEQRTLHYHSSVSVENHRSAALGESTLSAACKIREGLAQSDSIFEEAPRQAADRHLLSEVARGRADAFALLYDRLSSPLYAMCLRMTGDASTAEEILQEAFLVVWRKAKTYDPAHSSVFSWAVHLTRCTAIDLLRSRGRRLRVLDPAPGNASDAAVLSVARLEPEASASPAPDAADGNERAARVQRVLGSMPIEQRQAVELAFFSDLSHHEISARLEQPLSTIKTRIRRGLLSLRAGLERTH